MSDKNGVSDENAENIVPQDVMTPRETREFIRSALGASMLVLLVFGGVFGIFIWLLTILLK